MSIKTEAEARPATRFARPSETTPQALGRALRGHEIIAEISKRIETGEVHHYTRSRIRLAGRRQGLRIALELAHDIVDHCNDRVRWFVVVGDKEIPL